MVDSYMGAAPVSCWRQMSVKSVVALGVATLMLSGCEKQQQGTAAAGAGRALPVSVVTIETKDVPLANEWVGVLDGYVNAQIQPQVSGYLLKQDYKEGSQVAKGQVLFEIDQRPFRAALGQAEGQLGQAQAQLGLAQINVKRDTPLAQARAIAQSQLDNETQQMLQAEAAVKTAQAAVDNAKLNIGFTQVRSIISGIAGQATTQVGNLVGPQSVLTSVSQLNPVKVYFSISDSEYLTLTSQAKEKGGDLLKGNAKMPLTMLLSNSETYPYKGQIVFVDRQMDAQTGAIRVAASFPNPGNVLRPGQFARIKADTQVRHGAVLVPQVALQELQGVQQVFVVDNANKVHVVNLKVGPQVGENWLVEDGLKPGDKVAVDNLQKLRDGAEVSPHPAQPAPAAAGQTAAGR